MAFQAGITWANGTNGIREDLADVLAVADNKATPFVSKSPKGKDLGNVLFSWQADGYTAPKSGGVQDGLDVVLAADATSNASSARVRLYNWAQVFRRVHRTGFIQQEMTVAAVSDETARGVAKRLVELKRDMEATLTGYNQLATNETSTAGSLTGSLGNWIGTANATGFGGVPSSTLGVSPNSLAINTQATTSFSEAVPQAMLAGIFNETGVISTLDAIVGASLKRAFTNLITSGTTVTTGNANTIAATGVRTFNTDLSGDTFKASIDIFEGDFGTLILTPSALLNYGAAGTLTPNTFFGYIIDFNMVEVRYAQLPNVQELPNAGGGPVRLVQAIAGLVVKNPAGMGFFKTTT